jgi:hypothetical protein
VRAAQSADIESKLSEFDRYIDFTAGRDAFEDRNMDCAAVCASAHATFAKTSSEVTMPRHEIANNLHGSGMTSPAMKRRVIFRRLPSL